MGTLVDQLKKRVTGAGFRLIQPGRAPEQIGDTAEFDWVMAQQDTLRSIFRRPSMNLGQTYMDGSWHVDSGNVLDLLEVLIRAFPRSYRARSQPLLKLAGTLQSLNRIARSYRNVERHYDLDERLFRLFLDEDMHYSCAYFRAPHMTLEQAQQAKCAHIAAKLLLEPGQRVLDIGCGWGSMSLYLAEHFDVQVTGVTLSSEQLRVARQRAAERGLEDKAHFALQDYREHHGHYDRIVSVGMFEHVGRSQFRTYFDKVRGFLPDDGVALIHTIGCFSPPNPTNPWIARHIFPGGYIPSTSEMTAAIELSGLVQTDTEFWRVHYADTLKEWNRRFQATREQFVGALGERFCRMWEFYLQASEASFRWRSLMVIQSQLARDLKTVPLGRDYMYR